MTTRVVLDANVLAPGFVGSASASVGLINLWRSGVYELVVSTHLLSELTRALSDPYYAARVTPEQAGHILDLLRSEAVITPITASVVGVATQPKDDLVLATGLSAQARYLATRDKQLLKIEHFEGMTILHPVDLLDLLMRAEGTTP